MPHDKACKPRTFPTKTYAVRGTRLGNRGCTQMPSRTCFIRFSQDIRVEESREATTDQYTYSDIRAYNGSRTPSGHDKREMAVQGGH